MNVTGDFEHAPILQSVFSQVNCQCGIDIYGILWYVSLQNGDIMPERFRPNRPGFLDGILHLYAVGYICMGLSWIFLRTSSTAATIPWFHGLLSNFNIGLWFIVGGAIILVTRSLWRNHLSMTISLTLAMFVSLFSGLISVIAWYMGFYVRGLVPGTMLIFISAVLWWSASSAYRAAKQDREELELELLRKG